MCYLKAIGYCQCVVAMRTQNTRMYTHAWCMTLLPMHEIRQNQHEKEWWAYTVLPRCYALLAVTPPPPLFSGEITVKGYFTSITRPPPAGRSSRFAVLQFCTCTRVASVEELYMCIKRVENSLRTGLGPFR